MPGRCSSQDDVLPLIRNLKLTLLSHRWSLQLVTTIRRCHQQSAPALLLEKLRFHEHQHGTRGQHQGDFRPFKPASVAENVYLATFRWRPSPCGPCFPGRCKPPVPCYFTKKKVLSLLDSPVPGKNIVVADYVIQQKFNQISCSSFLSLRVVQLSRMWPE